MALLDAGADVKARGKDGLTPLMLAMRYLNDVELIQRFLDEGVSVQAKSGDGTRAINWAGRFAENPEVISMLVKAGADVNDKHGKGQTVLMDAAIFNHNPDVIKALIDAGADVNATWKDSYDYLYSPFTYAAWHNNAEVIKVLAAAGADVTVKHNPHERPQGKHGGTAIHLACLHNKKLSVIQALIDVKVPPDGPILAAAIHNEKNREEDLGIVQALIKAGANLEMRAYGTDSPLITALHGKCSYDVVKALLDAGADINARASTLKKSLLAPGAFQFSSGFSSGDLRVSMLYITCMTNIGTRCK